MKEAGSAIGIIFSRPLPKDFPKDAFCGPAYVEISKDGEVLKLYNEIPDGATLVDEKITKEAMKAWTLRAKEKWNQ